MFRHRKNVIVFSASSDPALFVPSENKQTNKNNRSDLKHEPLNLETLAEFDQNKNFKENTHTSHVKRSKGFATEHVTCVTHDTHKSYDDIYAGIEEFTN